MEAGEAHGAEQGPGARSSMTEGTPKSAGTGGQTDGEMGEVPSWYFHFFIIVSG